MGDEFINLQFVIHVLINKFWNRVTTLVTSKSRSFPNSAGHQLEGSGTDLLASCSDTNDNRFSPTFVTGFQSRSHSVDVTNTFECISHPPSVILTRASCVVLSGQSLGLKPSVAPNFIAIGNLSGLMSTAMILDAPAFLHPIMTAKPTHPTPHTAQIDPSSTLAVFMAAPYPVVIPQPNRQTDSNLASFLTLANEISAHTVYSANVLQPMK